MVPKIWHSDEMSPDSLYFLITYGVCKKRKYYFSTFFIYTIDYQTQTNTKKSSEKELRHFAFYRTGAIIFTVRIIFFGVLRKYWSSKYWLRGALLDFRDRLPCTERAATRVSVKRWKQKITQKNKKPSGATVTSLSSALGSAKNECIFKSSNFKLTCVISDPKNHPNLYFHQYYRGFSFRWLLYRIYHFLF